MKPDKSIVVGVDVTMIGLSAVEYAADEARTRALGIRLIRVHPLSLGLDRNPGRYGLVRVRETGEEAINTAEQLLWSIAPGVPVERELVAGVPSRQLIAASGTAAVVVLGQRRAHHRHGGSDGVTEAVAIGAKAPVIAVPADWSSSRRGDRVVVGVDGSRQSGRALAYGFEEAAFRGAELMVVGAWGRYPYWRPDFGSPVATHAEWFASSESALETQLGEWRDRYPEVSVVRFIEQSADATHTLVRHCGGAGLLVVGAHGRGGLPGALLGRTARCLLQEAPCPVAVIHLDDANDDAPSSYTAEADWQASARQYAGVR